MFNYQRGSRRNFASRSFAGTAFPLLPFLLAAAASAAIVKNPASQTAIARFFFRHQPGLIKGRPLLRFGSFIIEKLSDNFNYIEEAVCSFLVALCQFWQLLHGLCLAATIKIKMGTTFKRWFLHFISFISFICYSSLYNNN